MRGKTGKGSYEKVQAPPYLQGSESFGGLLRIRALIQYGLQLVGLLSEGHLQKGHPAYRNSHIVLIRIQPYINSKEL